MIGILIIESRNKSKTEISFYKGLNAQIKKWIISSNGANDNILMIRNGFYNKPDNLKSIMEEMLKQCNNPIFLVCDNENKKIERTEKYLNKNEITNWIITSKDSPLNYDFEDFLSYHKHPIETINNNYHKNNKDVFNYFGKKFYLNFHKEKYKNMLLKYLENLSKDIYHGKIIKVVLEIMNKDSLID